ncbi:MAG: hypothetical protein AB1480_00230 [Nitrospirota bacterium]
MKRVPLAVVLGCGINGLGMIRSLGRENIPIFALDPDPNAIGMYSRFISKGIVCPDPLHSESDLIDFLMDLGKTSNNTKFLFPANDSYVAAIAKAKDKLETYYKVPFPGWDVIKDIVDKENQYKRAAEYDILLPETFYPKEKKDIEEISRNVNFPVILKPAHSYAFLIKYGIKAVKCTSKDKLIEEFEKYSITGFKMIIQEVIEGDASNLYEFQSYTNQKRDTLAMFMGRKLEQHPSDFGTGTAFESVEEPRIVELGLRVLEVFNCHGISFSEFKLDPKDRKFKLIEFNPRATHCNSLSTECGVNIPYAVYKDVTEEYKGKAILSYRVGKEWVWPENGFLERKRFMIYIKNIFTRKKCIYAIFSLNDPMPEISLFYNVLRQYIKGFLSMIKKVFLKL